MDIYTIRDKLKRSIQGKEQALEVYRKVHRTATGVEEVALYASIQFLEVNLVELQSILKDVEVVVEQTMAKSWEGVDRQGGI